MQDIDKNTLGPKNHVCLLVRTDNATIRIWLICLIMHCFNMLYVHNNNLEDLCYIYTKLFYSDLILFCFFFNNSYNMLIAIVATGYDLKTKGL